MTNLVYPWKAVKEKLQQMNKISCFGTCTRDNTFHIRKMFMFQDIKTEEEKISQQSWRDGEKATSSNEVLYQE